MGIKPGKYNPLKPDIELLDYKSKRRYGLKLDGASALQIATISQDDTVHIRAQGKQVGDFDEQRSWKGGRGIDKLSDNTEGYWDSKDAWTLGDGHVHQTLLWQVARGLRSCDVFLPDKSKSMTWRSLVGESTYLDMLFTSSGFAAAYARVWIRKVGTPGDLTVRITADSGGAIGAVAATATVSSLDDVLSVFEDFALSTTLVASTAYHLVIFGSPTDNKTNHWQIGGWSGGTTGKMSSGGSSWSSANFDPYYYICDADINRTFFSFVLDEAFYVVSKNDDGTASKVYINGDRGKLTGVSGLTVTDSGKSWTTNRFQFARINIVRGKGKGQTRYISSHTGTVITVARAWDITPDTTSEYVIYDTPWFTEVSTAGLAQVYSQPIVVNRIVYFPQGTTGYIRRMIWTGTAHAFTDDGTNYAGYLLKTQDQVGVRVWRALTQVSYAPATAWANPPTALTYGTAQYVGDETSAITNLAEKDGLVFILKEDGIFYLPSNSTTLLITRVNNGIDKTPSRDNGRAVVAHQQFLYYSWLHSLIRVYGSSHDDIGQDWSGKGLPDTREGNISAMTSYISLLICGVDADVTMTDLATGTSSVLGWDGLGWHEILRAYDVGKKIRMVAVQVNPEARNRLWTDVGGDLVYQELPLRKSSPLLDSGCRYMHEAVVESAAIDMGTASALPKFIKELTVMCENLGEGNEISVDYQVDDDVHTTTWTPATVLLESPESSAFLGLSNIRKFAYRLRINSNDNASPVDIQGVIPNGYARVPYKMVWTLRCRADNITSKGRLVKPDALMRWLLDNARHPGRVEMHSQYELAHKFFVIIHPPRMFPYKPAQNGQAEESMFTLVLEEA